MSRFIVAEISKNWAGRAPYVPGKLLSEQFEEVINNNFKRGFRLQSFSLHRLVLSPEEMNETIIAVFETVEEKP